MHERALRQAVATAAVAMLITTSGAIADTVPADGDDVTTGIQDFFEIGPIGTGATVTAAIWFDLECNTTSHVDVGQAVRIAFGVPDVPVGGAASGTGTTIGPVPASWAADGSLCPAGTAPLRSATPATVTLRAPAEPGVFDYIVNFTRALDPAGSGDAAALRGPSRVFFELTVVPDAPPSLVLPAAIAIEGDTTGGAMVTYAVGASDPEDVPPPTPVCVPASGSFFALGETAVSCSVADSAGHHVSGAFTVGVVDTTPPVLGEVPRSVELTTGDPGGTIAIYVPPSAADLVDPSPAVACAPAPGDAVPVGTTTVTCTATDGSGNAASASFALNVSYVPPVVLAARFDEPIGESGVLTGTSGRTVPVKARVLRDGAPVTAGSVDLALARCEDGTTVGSPVALAWQGGRWMVELATDGLLGCLRATVRLDGRDAGAFELRLGPSASTFKAKSARR